MSSPDEPRSDLPGADEQALPVAPEPRAPDPVTPEPAPPVEVPEPVATEPAEPVPPAMVAPTPTAAAAPLATPIPPVPVTTDGAEPDDGDPTPGPRRTRLVLLGAGLAVALLLAGVAILGLKVRDAGRTDTARSEAVAASRDAARLLFSYDYKSLDADFAKGLAVTTGQFRQEYRRTTQEVVAPVARQYQAVVRADVVESAVVSASPDEVTTIVFLNQATTSTRVEGQQVDNSRVRMTLTLRDGRWLVSKVEAL